MLRIALSLIFLCFLSGSLFAQTKVRGKVTDQNDKPLEGVIVTAVRGESRVEDETNQKGDFELGLDRGSWDIRFYYVYGIDTLRRSTSVSVEGEKELRLDHIRAPFTILDESVVYGKQNTYEGVTRLRTIDLQKAMVTTEKYLVYATAATSNNELTSNYNVRGGNYDENLVYVNGFLINRPFLTRSGQQEGMSFINTALVDDIYFSGGGFQARYGDKLSSVLAVQYKRPDSLHSSLTASLLGVEAHLEQGVGSRFRYLLGARYRANGYLLNSLPTKGNYNPVFMDGQFLTEFDITEKWQWSVLGHFSSNQYVFAPETQATDFGTANEAYTFNIYFDGQENTRFLTGTAGTALSYDGKKLFSKTYFTAFRTDEREEFDIQGQYYINELETDPSKEDYGDSIAVLGVGTFLNHARNRLQASIYSVYNDSKWTFNEHSALSFGAGVQYDDFHDVLSEWRMVDSAGYSLPQNDDSNVELLETIKGRLSLQNTRVFGYVQQHFDWRGRERTVYLEDVEKKMRNGKVRQYRVRDTVEQVSALWQVEIGTRALYTSFNDDYGITPRASIAYMPAKYVLKDSVFRRRYVKYGLAAGLYYQPPFYREFRTFAGALNPSVVSQKSFHIVASADYTFYMANHAKPFKFTAEGYYKYLWDVNTYEIENVRTRYYANNEAIGYATGLDMTLNGEFVEGIPSFFKLSFLSTKEDILNDYYYNYYNAEGERITPLLDDQVAVDSAIVHPGYVRRPTDQHMNAAILFQDKMPGFERFTAQMGLIFGSRLPYGPPDFTRYKDTLSMKSYFRVDLGLSYDFLHYRERVAGKWYGKFQDAIISFEIFNLLGINNVLSKQWIQDVNGRYYSIPNYLTQRRFNLKLILRI
jgi:hypothetical protein